MARKISKRYPLRNAYETCLACKKVDIKAIKRLTLEELDAARSICANCVSETAGIYKTDAIATAFEAEIKYKKEVGILHEIIASQQAKIRELKEKNDKSKWYRRGKGATYFKRYSESIKNLQSEGKTQKQISEILGISISSVNKICKELKNYSSYPK